MDRDQVRGAEGGREDLVLVAGCGVGAGAGEEGEVGEGGLLRELVAVGAAVLEAGWVGGAVFSLGAVADGQCPRWDTTEAGGVGVSERCVGCEGRGWGETGGVGDMDNELGEG